MNKSNQMALCIVAVGVVGFSSWFGWTSFTHSRTHWIENKVNQALSASFQGLVLQWPRTQIRSNLSNGVYYSPTINDPALSFQLYRHTLEYLNQDGDMPPVKISQVTMGIEYGATQDNLNIQVVVEFPLIAGLDKVFIVHDTVVMQHYSALKLIY